MTITTSRGKTFNVEWAWADKSGILRMELKDERSAGEIIADFDGIETISRKSKEEGDATYSGYSALIGFNRNTEQGTVLLTLKKAVNNNG